MFVELSLVMFDCYLDVISIRIILMLVIVDVVIFFDVSEGFMSEFRIYNYIFIDVFEFIFVKFLYFFCFINLCVYFKYFCICLVVMDVIVGFCWIKLYIDFDVVFFNSVFC